MESKKRIDISLEREMYKQRLIRMYESAVGTKVHRESLTDIQKIVDYYAQLEKFKKYYRSLLSTLKVDYNQAECVEVGVGPVDSILKDTPATIVTPYYGLFPKREGKTYEGNYVINHGNLEMMDDSKRMFEVETSPLEIGLGRVYITNNILDPYSLNSFLKLSRKNQIVVGAYGMNSDSDRGKKLEIMKKFAKQIDDVSYNSCIHDNCYCEIVQGRGKCR